MQQASVQGFFTALNSDTRRVIAQPPPSGVRLRGPVQPFDVIRELAHKAEALDLEPLAFELFFIASRLEETGRIDVARRDLDEAAQEVSEDSPVEARFYRRAARSLDTVA